LKGYSGKILLVDLSRKSFSTIPLKERIARNFIGGTGLGIKILMDQCPVGIDPLSPANALVLTTGPTGGTMTPTGGNGHVFLAKSPETGMLGQALSHGSFGCELKRTGYDAVVIKGKANKPVYLFIDDSERRLVECGHLLGKSTYETESAIKEEIGDFGVRVASIGIGGENLVKYACIMNERHRAAGRTGMGAIMGSKNLKAIAVRGTNAVEVGNPREFKDLVKVMCEMAKGPATEKYRTLGTPLNVLVLNGLSALPTRNFTSASFEKADIVSGETLKAQLITKTIGCSTCPILCEHLAQVSEGPYKGTLTRAEFETLWALGPNCGIDRLDAIVRGMELTNRYGIDSISTGVSISFAMDCYEQGILSEKDTDGLELKFGNHQAMLEMIERIAFRKGLGNILAEGVRNAAEKIGNGANKLANHIKGLEMTGYDLRGLKTAALGFAVSFRGACHNRHGAYDYDLKGQVDRLSSENKGELVRKKEEWYAIIDSLIICKFSRGLYKDEFGDSARLYSLVTGMPTTSDDLRKAGERIINLARIFNIREGLTREDDHLPAKIMTVPIPDEGPVKGSFVSQADLDKMLDDYYRARGWSTNGVPSLAKLRELELEEYADIIIPLL
jgi:aldehyde:ferredoxin oxidoreductase